MLISIFNQYNAVLMFEVTTIKEIKVKIGSVCRQHRQSNNMSREQLAEALEVSSTTIQNIENGKNATMDNVLKVANHFVLLGSISKELDKAISTKNNISFY